MEETVKKLTDGLNELVFAALQPRVSNRRQLMRSAADILKAIDRVCDVCHIEFPDEAVEANAEIDQYFGISIL